MYPTGYFPRPGSSSSSTGTGLTPAEKQDLTDVTLWYRGILQAGGLQDAVYRNPANPDTDLVNVGTLLSVVSDRAPASVVAEVDKLRVRYEVVGQAEPGASLGVQGGRFQRNTVYLCYPTSGYVDPGSAVAYLIVDYPLLAEPCNLWIVNQSPTNRSLRVYVVTPSTLYNAGRMPTFARGTLLNASFSNVNLSPGRTLRLQYHPPASNVFTRNGVGVPGFIEYDEEADPARTLLPVNNNPLPLT